MNTQLSFKKSGFRTIAVALAASFLASAALPVSSAYAHDRFGSRHYHNYDDDYGDYREHRRHRKERRYKKRHKRKNNNGDLIAAGIVGLAIGVLLSEGSRKKHQRSDVYYNDRRRPLNDVREDNYLDYQDDAPIQLGKDTIRNDKPEVITYSGSVIEPWTVEWYRYCENKYRSFEAKSGTFTGYDGKKRFCVPK